MTGGALLPCAHGEFSLQMSSLGFQCRCSYLGIPESPLRWTSKSVRKLAKELQRMLPCVSGQRSGSGCLTYSCWHSHVLYCIAHVGSMDAMCSVQRGLLT